jgi:CheY-like chemotaxis protein
VASGAAESPADGFRVLVIDDEKNIRTTLSVCVGMGCAATCVGSAVAALDALERSSFDIAFLDLRLAGADGLELLPRLLALRPSLAVVVVTAYATFNTAVEAIKRSAVDYLPKPFTPAQIRHAIEQVARRKAMEHRVTDLECTGQSAASRRLTRASCAALSRACLTYGGLPTTASNRSSSPDQANRSARTTRASGAARRAAAAALVSTSTPTSRPRPPRARARARNTPLPHAGSSTARPLRPPSPGSASARSATAGGVNHCPSSRRRAASTASHLPSGAGEQVAALVRSWLEE